MDPNSECYRLIHGNNRKKWAVRFNRKMWAILLACAHFVLTVGCLCLGLIYNWRESSPLDPLRALALPLGMILMVPLGWAGALTLSTPIYIAGVILNSVLWGWILSWLIFGGPYSVAEIHSSDESSIPEPAPDNNLDPVDSPDA